MNKKSKAENNAVRDYILDSASFDDQLSFLFSQIKDPFTTDVNHFKRVKKYVENADDCDGVCNTILDKITERYPNLDFDLNNYDKRLDGFTDAVYKFFIKNISKLTYVFLKEYIFNNKNRKNLLVPYLNLKLANYPKEQYGKKEYYILITKLKSIVNDIINIEISLTEFIEYIQKANESAMYIDIVAEYYENGLIQDLNVYKDIMKLFKNSDEYSSTINKLSLTILNNIVNPYVQETGLSEVQIKYIDDNLDDTLTNDDDIENEEE